MITVDTNVQAERFEFLKVDNPSMAVGLMDPFEKNNINEAF